MMCCPYQKNICYDLFLYHIQQETDIIRFFLSNFMTYTIVIVIRSVVLKTAFVTQYQFYYYIITLGNRPLQTLTNKKVSFTGLWLLDIPEIHPLL